MPHVIVKLWPGKSKKQKQRLADAIAKDVMEILNYGEESVSVAMEKKVYKADIQARPDQIYRKPGYRLEDL